MTQSNLSDPDMFRLLGVLTRQLHDALNELGYTDRIQGTVDQLPDAKSRLAYIARLTGEAAEKVLLHVEAAKADEQSIFEKAKELHESLSRIPGLNSAMPELSSLAGSIMALSQTNDQRLTEIMIAQDFHDLTGQVIGRVVQLASSIEEQLLGLLLQTAPSLRGDAQQSPSLEGPVVDPASKKDVASNQQQVDDLLASLGF